MQDHIPPKALAQPPVLRARLRPDDDVPVALRRRDSCAAQAADERMTGAGWQSYPPRDQVPDNRTEQRTNQRVTGQRRDVRVEQT